MLQLPPLSLYVHLPWCVRKCPYCDFNSHPAPAQLPQMRYVDALLEDLDHDLQYVQQRPLTSVFFGGGTPSLFSPDAISRIISAVIRRFATSSLEITLEANPGTIEHGRFAEYRAAGIDRVSLGAQSFSDEHLQALGRIHGAGEIGRAVDELLRAGIDNFNLDLMYGLPHQTIEQAEQDVATAVALQPAHISYYELTLEPGTAFYHRPPTLPDPDTAWEMQVRGQTLLAHQGYAQYEVSAYARTGRQCAHNLNYWQFGDYLGIGAGAHGKYTDALGKNIFRTQRQRFPTQYLGAGPAQRVVENRKIAAADLSFEFFLNALRLSAGFSRRQFETRTGQSFESIQDLLLEAQQRDWLRTDSAHDQWMPTEKGMRFLNDLQALFLPPLSGEIKFASAF
jgi:putative oxygen-independent coproporphyrinogen III oxidase